MPPTALLSEFLSRETSPPNFRIWKGAEPDKFRQAEAEYGKWLEFLSTIEGLFQKFVYENPEAQQLDFRLHRQYLHTAIAWGESVAIAFEMLGERDGAPNYVHLIAQKLASLGEVLQQWHGATEAQSDVPESFKTAMAEVRRGAGGGDGNRSGAIATSVIAQDVSLLRERDVLEELPRAPGRTEGERAPSVADL